MELLLTLLGLSARPPLRLNLRVFWRMLTPPSFAISLHLHRTATNESMNSMRLHWRSAYGVAFSGPAVGSQSFADRPRMAQLTAEPSLSLGRDPWPMPLPDPLVDRGARSSRSRSRWRKAAAVREFVRFGVLALNLQTGGHPIACPPACRVGVPRTYL